MAKTGNTPNEIDDSVFWSLTAPDIMSGVDNLLGGSEFDLQANMPNLNFPMPPFNFDSTFTTQYPWPDFVNAQEGM